jgi:hypothetical protein
MQLIRRFPPLAWERLFPTRPKNSIGGFGDSTPRLR